MVDGGKPMIMISDVKYDGESPAAATAVTFLVRQTERVSWE